MVKKYQDEIPPISGRVYDIEPVPDSDLSRIVDATQYEQAGVEFKAADVCATCTLECNYAYSAGNHALTHPNEAPENLKFKPTRAYRLGETFTFNGERMGAFTADGQPLENGFFQADTIVECLVMGKNLFFMSRGRSLTDDEDDTNRIRFGMENGRLYVDYD